MSKVTHTQVLKLYKELLRYSEKLKFTDKDFFRHRIKQEFAKNKGLLNETEINYSFKENYSKVPPLLDKDLEEMHVRGSGPGGQKVNKTANCVVLKHIPTGILVKCQETRELHKNQKIARMLLQTRLDNFVNGENSVEAQIKANNIKRSSVQEQKREKIRILKETWKNREYGKEG